MRLRCQECYDKPYGTKPCECERESWAALVVVALMVLVVVLFGCRSAHAATTTERALEYLCGPRGVQYAGHIDEAARKYLHHPVTLATMMAKESTCDADAVGARGEIGLMQIMPGRRSPAANGLTRRQLRDPRTNIMAGARWLTLRQVECGGTLLMGFAGYNGRTCAAGKKYAHRVVGMLARVWKELQRRREPRS